MSNRQARRDQMRATRQQRAQQTRPTRPGKTPGGPTRGGGGSGLAKYFSSWFVLIVAAVVLGLVAILVVVVVNGGSSSSDVVTSLKASDAAFPFDMTKGLKVGRDDAPIKLTEFEDFQCPFCLRYTSNQEPGIIAEYVKTGKVQIEFKHLPLLGAESVRAAKAAECVGQQDKFWQFHNKLFLVQAEAGQATAEKLNVGRFSDDKLKGYAVDVGVDPAKYDACFTSEDTLRAVTASQQQATQFGIRGTPGFLLNGAPIGSGSPSGIEGWRTVFDETLKALANPTASTTGSATASTSASATATKPAATATATATATKTP